MAATGIAGKKRYLLAAAILALLLGVLPGCGGSSNPSVTIGAGASAEEEVLAQIYVQALRRSGFDAGRVVPLGAEPRGAAAVKQGKITAYVDHLSTPTGLAWGGTPHPVPADPETAYRQELVRLGRSGMTAFPPTPYSFTNLVGALRPFAEKQKLKTISDLQGRSEGLTIAGVTGCHEAMNCVEGLERLYGLKFAGFIYKLTVETEPFEALATRFSNLAMLPSTDGRLSAERNRYATLEDDKHLFPAGNAILVTTEDVADAGGSELEAAVAAAQKGLTLPVVQRLDAEVEIEKRDPAAVAAAYLKQSG